MCNFSSRKNLILGRLKQGWAEDRLNGLNVDVCCRGRRAPSLQSAEWRALTEVGRLTRGLRGTGACALSGGDVHGFESGLE